MASTSKGAHPVSWVPRVQHLFQTAAVSGLVVAAGCLDKSPVQADLTPPEVPTFRIRARVVSINGLPPGGKQFKVRLTTPRGFNLSAGTEAVDGNEWSDWMTFGFPEVTQTLQQYPASSLKKFPVTVLLRTDGVVDTTVIEAQLTLDATDAEVKLKGELFGPKLGILVWRDEQNRPRAGTMADYNQRYWKTLAGVKIPNSKRPKLITIADRFMGGDDDKRNWREGIRNLAQTGCNTISLPPSRLLRTFLLDAGLRRTAWGVYQPPGAVISAPLTPENLQTWAQQQAQPYRDAGYSARDMALSALADEPMWFYPLSIRRLSENPAALRRFRDYLKAQKLEPSEVGASSWDQVLPIGRSKAADLPSRRLYYWTVRFFPWDSSRYYAECTQALTQAFYRELPVHVNWNNFKGRHCTPGPRLKNPDPESPDSGMGAHDWFEFARTGGSTMMWTEDWFGDNQAFLWSYLCAKLRSAGAKRGLRFGGYIVPRTSGNRADGLQQKLLCLVGNGAKAVSEFMFGPEYVFPGNCYSDHGNGSRLSKLAEAHQMIGAAEHVLWPGKMPRPEVAILASRSAQVWDTWDAKAKDQILDTANNVELNSTDYDAETLYLYQALLHANIPADFVDEDDLTASALRPYRVLYVTEPDIPIEGQRGLADWVRAGGTLVTVSGAGQSDRYNEPTTIIQELGATPQRRRDRQIIANIYQLERAGRGTGVMGDFFAWGKTAPFTGIDHREPSFPATFADATAAIAVRQVQQGRMVQFAWLPGLSYRRTAGLQVKDSLPTGFPGSIRSWIIYPTQLAKVVPPVAVDQPMVEAPMLLSSAGAAVTLLNWTGEPLGQINLTVRVPFAVRSVESVKRGALKFQRSGEGVKCTLPLGAADIVKVLPAASG
jgi:hypothetical protein